MPLPASNIQRSLEHTRNFSVEFFRRDDGLWDIDARITDVKTRDVTVRSGTLPAHHPIHDLLIRVTVDPDGNIVDALALLDAVPMQGYCETIADVYKQLIGMNVLGGFRHRLRDRFAGVEGCTHLNELAMILPDAAAQVIAYEKRHRPENQGMHKKPSHLDGCHALRTDGPAVAMYYPEWVNRSTK